MTITQVFTKGFFRENPVLILLLGLCPVLAVSVSVKNAIGMGAAATFVLICSNTIIALFGKFFPSKIRIPCYIVVIATFVSIVEMIMGAYLPALNQALGIFIPLIVVNCIILGRAEAFASRHNVFLSILDGLGMGIGFGIALAIIAMIREVLGSGKFWDITISNFYSANGAIQPMAVMIMAPGAFIAIGLIIGFINWKRSS
ncbi:electron transport complex subunit E [bacterium]|nr:electron transport complex subunit E [bacterium]